MDRRLSLRPALRNAVATSGGVLVETGLRIVYLIFIARYVSLADYGLWAYGAASYGLALGMIVLGFDFLISRRIGGGEQNVDGFLAATLSVRLVMLAIATLGFVALAFLVEPAGPARWVILALIPAMVGRGVGLWVLNCFVAFEKAHEYLPVTLMLRAGEAALGIAILLFGGGITEVILNHVAFRIVEGVAGYLLVRRKLTPIQPRWNDQVRGVLRESAPLGANGLLVQWLMLSPLVLLRLSGQDLATLGVLGLSLNLTLILITVANGFLAALVPSLSREGGGAAYANIVALSALLMSFILAAIAWAIASDVAALVVGEAFRRSGELMTPLAIVAGLAVAAAGFLQSLTIKGRVGYAMIANGGGAVSLTVLMSPMTDWWGVSGGVGALAISFAIRFCLAFGLSLRG